MSAADVSPVSSVSTASPAASPTPALHPLALPKHRPRVQSSVIHRLASSPVTPRNHAATQASPPQTPPQSTAAATDKDAGAAGPTESAPTPLPPLLDSESDALAVMLQHVARRRQTRIALVASTVAVGNTSFLDSRHVLVEWMIDVCSVFGFLPTTLHAAVRNVDWFMSKRRLSQNAWQLCAVACVFIAAKCEEHSESVPLLSELQQVCGDAYEADVVKGMEVLVLEVLEWDPLDRGAVHFLSFNLRTLQRLIGDAQEQQIEADGAVPPRPRKRSRGGAARDAAALADSVDAAGRPAKLLKTQSSADATSESFSDGRGDGDDVATALLACRSPASHFGDAGVDLDPDALAPAPVDHFTSHLTGEVLAHGRTANAVLDQALFDPALCATQNPQHIAAAAIFVARRSDNQTPAWPRAYQAATGLAEEEFAEQSGLLMHVFTDAEQADAPLSTFEEPF